MPHDVVHFAIHADDCERARAFYEAVFGWTFEPWGPPNFWQIFTSPDASVRGALHGRHEPASGTGMTGFQCTIGVEDVAAITDAVRQHGGSIVHEPMTIDGVGDVMTFRDPEGNVVSAMQYATR